MLRFILRRFIFLVFVLIGISIFLFIIMYTLPGDPAKTAAGVHAKPEQVESIRRQLGLDKPIHIQYLTYVQNVFRGNLGTSALTRKPVISELKTYLPATLELVLSAMIIIVMVAFPLGIFSALKPGKLADNGSRLFAALGMGMPVFWVGLIAQLLFYGKLGVLPFGGRLTPGVTPPIHVTGFYTIDSLLMWDIPLFGDSIWHLILPAFVLALPEVAVISRLLQCSMLDVLNQDYIRTARAKGLKEKRIIGSHAMKNAILVPITMLGIQLGMLLGGTLLVESVFSWGGLGFFVYHGIQASDFPVVMGTTMIVTVIFVLSNLVVDILYGYLDPRIIY